MSKYLITYRLPDGSFVSELIPVKAVAEFVLNRPREGYTEIRVYRILPARVEQLEIRTHEWRVPRAVSLYDRYGNYIDQGECA